MVVDDEIFREVVDAIGVETALVNLQAGFQMSVFGVAK